MKEGITQPNQESIPEINLSSEKKESVKVLEIITWDGKKISLECSSYNFEYPQRIQKETGILGYERTLISNDEIEKTSGNNEYDIYRKIISELSLNRFPDESFTYGMGIRNSEYAKDFYNAKFKKERFLLQNIFDLENYQNMIKDGFGYGPSGDSNPDISIFDVFDKKTNKIVGYYILDEIYKKYKTQLENNEIMIVSANGLNVHSFGFFEGIKISDKKIAGFGFDRQDHLFQDYTKKSIDLLRELNNINRIDSIELEVAGKSKDEKILKKYQPKLYSDIIFLNLFSLKESEYSNDKLFYDVSSTSDNKPLNNKWEILSEKYGSAFNSNNSISKKNNEEINQNDTIEKNLFAFYVRDNYFDIKKLWPNGVPWEKDKYDHLNDSWGSIFIGEHLPVFINNDNLNQLKWGHANYATFWTEKGFNFLKIKHADKFPEDPLEEAKKRVRDHINKIVDEEINKNKE